MLKILEKFWLTVAAIAFLYGIFRAITASVMDGAFLFAIGLVCVLFYWRSHKQRLKEEHDNLNQNI